MKDLSHDQKESLLSVLRKRFEGNMSRHDGITWEDVQTRLVASHGKLWSLSEMERTGGEPDVVKLENFSEGYCFIDCSQESPGGRRSLCYDPAALTARKEAKPEDNVVGMAMRMGIEILTEEQYRQLQCKGEFDLRTSSWIKTPDDIRARGGALFCDRRYGHVFVYHNGASSYYSSRSFRGLLRV